MRLPLITSLITLSTLALPAHAAPACKTNVDGNVVCVHRVTANRKTPWMNRAFISVNGGNVYDFMVDCSDRTYLNTSGRWTPINPNSAFESVCTEWSF
jgi:hypothetical protein